MTAAGWRSALGLILILTVVGVGVSRPLVTELGRAFPLGADAAGGPNILVGVPSDTLQLYYQLWLVRDGLWGPAPFLHDPYQFRIDRPRPNALQTFPPLAIPFVLLSPFGPEAAYGLLVLLTFPASGLLAAGLVRHLTGSAAAAALAGVGFAVAPSRLIPLFGGHPAGFVLGLAPAALWGLDRALVAGCPWGGLAGGLAVLALATTEPQYAYLLAGVLVAHAALRWRFLVPSRPRSWGALLVFSLVAAAGVVWLWGFRQTLVADSVAPGGRGLEELRIYAPGLVALSRPGIYGGLGLGLLALLGVSGTLHGPERSVRVLYAGWLLVGLLLALGPRVPSLPLYELLHTRLPLFGLIRNPAKFSLLVAVGATVLAGYGARDLFAWLPGRLSGAAAILLGALVVVTAVPWQGIKLVRFPEHPAVNGLRHDARKVLYLPLWPGDSVRSSPYLLYLTRTRVPALNGYSPLTPRAYGTAVFEPLRGLNLGELGPAEHAALRRLEVSHVVVDGELFAPPASPFPARFTASRLAAFSGLEALPAQWPFWVFRVRDIGAPSPPPPVSLPLGVFFEAEWLPHQQAGCVMRDAEASGGRMVAGCRGSRPSGFVAYGQHQALPIGAYRAAFRVRGPGLRVDVSAEVGREIVAHRDVPPRLDWQIVTLPFTVARHRPLEFRVEWDGEGEPAVDWILVTFADRPEPEWAYEVEELPGWVPEREDATASAGRAAYVAPVPESLRDVVRGPARLFPAGRYRLVVWARRAEGPARGALLRLRVTEPSGRILASRVVKADEVAPDRYRAVTLDYALPDSRVLEFPIAYLGGPAVFLDRLEVSPR